MLVDAGARFDGKKILKQLEGRDLAAHALTHAHPDHQGASKLVCETRGVPFWVPAGDVEKAEHPEKIRTEQPENAINRMFFKTMAGPGHTVDRPLNEGDEVAGFKVLDAPGHSKGHVAYWRESDRVLILGDVLNNMDVFTGIPACASRRRCSLRTPSLNRDVDQEAGRARAVAGVLRPRRAAAGHREVHGLLPERLMARMEVSASGPVAAPAAEVWELLCDTSRYAEWVAGTDEVTRTDGPAREGSTYDEINPIVGPVEGPLALDRHQLRRAEPPGASRGGHRSDREVDGGRDGGHARPGKTPPRSR